MPAKKHDSDDQVVRAKKLEQAIDYVTTLEKHRKGIEAEIGTAVIGLLDSLDGPRLVQAVKEALVPLSSEGLADNLIKRDLAQVRDSLGEGYNSQVSDAWSALTGAGQAVLKRCVSHPNDPQALVAAAHLADKVLDLLSLMMLPAQQLADELIAVAEKKCKPISDTKRRKEIRDRRIKAMAKEMGTTSPAKIRDAGKNDSVIFSVCPPESFTSETVRNVLSPRRSKKK